MKMKKMKLLRVFVIAFAVAMVLGTTTTTFAAVNINDGWGKMPQIQQGSRNNAVSGCQSFLSLKGYSLGLYGIDGDFGAATRSAVKLYQGKQPGAVVADGIVGVNTWGKIRNDIHYFKTTATEYYYRVTSVYNNDFTHRRTGATAGSWWANVGGDMLKMCN